MSMDRGNARVLSPKLGSAGTAEASRHAHAPHTAGQESHLLLHLIPAGLPACLLPCSSPLTQWGEKNHEKLYRKVKIASCMFSTRHFRALHLKRKRSVANWSAALLFCLCKACIS